MTLAAPKQEEVMTNTPLAIFSCRQNSHPFQERHIYVANESVKVGRSVARARPAPNNAIFDCKVLSRNHAILWYEDNKFMLQDTKSSNGTYVNNQRLNKGAEDGEESEGHGRPIYSGDIIQFGVDVMENSRRVTHGCIVADVTLFHADGTEVKPPYDANGHASGTMVHLQELYQLSQYLQEAMHREHMVEDKLLVVEQLVQRTHEASEKGWQALIDEDRLLSRLEVLQSQLQACSKNQTEESLQEQVIRLHEHKVKYETTAKESLCKVVDEKLEAVQKVEGLEARLSNANQELTHLGRTIEDGQVQMTDLAQKLDEKTSEIKALEQKLEEAERTLAEKKDTIEVERAQSQDRCEQLERSKSTLESSLHELKEEHASTLDEVTQLKEKLQNSLNRRLSEGSETADGVAGSNAQEDVVTSDLVSAPDESTPTDECSPAAANGGLGPQPVSTTSSKNDPTVNDLMDKLEESEAILKEKEAKLEAIQSQLDQAQLEVVSYVTKVASLEAKQKMEEARLAETLSEAKGARLNEMASLSEQLRNATEENSSLKEQLERVSTDRDTGDRSQDKDRLLDEYRHQIKELREEVQAVRAVEAKEGLLQKFAEGLSQSPMAGSKPGLTDQSSERDAQEECLALKTECEELRTKVAAIEPEFLRAKSAHDKLSADLKGSKGEIAELKRKLSGLQISYDELKALNEKLQKKQEASAPGDDAQSDGGIMKSQLKEAQEEVAILRRKCAEYSTELVEMNTDIENLTKEYSLLADKSRMLSACSLAPVFALVVGIVMAFYPTLANLTATADPSL